MDEAHDLACRPAAVPIQLKARKKNPPGFDWPYSAKPVTTMTDATAYIPV